MSVRRAIPHRNGIYFITITCRGWHHLFELTNGYDVVYRWFDHLKGLGHHVIGYVVMPNHIHALLAFQESDKSINTIVGNGKRFMAYDLVRKLKEGNHENLLLELSSYVVKTERKKGKLHDVFEPSFDWKECYSDRVIEQKLNYIHENPCRGKWNLVKQPLEYVHSSARYYCSGEQGIYPIVSYGATKDIDLTKFVKNDWEYGSEAQSP